MDFVTGSFVALLLFCAAFKYATWDTKASTDDKASRALFFKYVPVFTLFKLADWCQGPYFYEIYQSKIDPSGENLGTVGLIFLSGFVSSMIFGTFVGGIVDRIGRKNGCLLYCVLYIGASLSVHFDSIFVLLLGRICGGIATSLLFSAPEAWLIGEVKSTNCSPDSLSFIFGWAYFLDGCSAILAGLLSQVARSMLGVTGAFDASGVILLFSFFYVRQSWTENFGDQTVTGVRNFSDGLRALRSPPVTILGLIQSIFEGSMYVFVLLWVPTLTDSLALLDMDAKLATGVIFSVFMIGCMIGSTVFSVSMRRHANVFSFSRFVFLSAALCFAMALIWITQVRFNYLFISYVLFEMCVGSYYPSIGMMRSVIIPESMRSTIMNFYRVPLNLYVIVSFLLVDRIGPEGEMGMSMVFMTLAFGAQHWLFSHHGHLAAAPVQEASMKSKGGTMADLSSSAAHGEEEDEGRPLVGEA